MEEQTAGTLTIFDLAERVGLPVRTVRFYISEGLLSGPGGRGRAASYGEEHLLRLKLISRLAGHHLPLKEIRDRLAGVSAEDVRALLAEEVSRDEAASFTQRPQSRREYLAQKFARAKEVRERLPESGGPAPTITATGGGGRGFPTGAASPGLEEGEQRYGAHFDLAAATPGRVHQAETWQRWVLAPGVELQVRGDAAGLYRDLIQRLLQVAGAVAKR